MLSLPRATPFSLSGHTDTPAPHSERGACGRAGGRGPGAPAAQDNTCRRHWGECPGQRLPSPQLAHHPPPPSRAAHAQATTVHEVWSPGEPWSRVMAGLWVLGKAMPTAHLQRPTPTAKETGRKGGEAPTGLLREGSPAGTEGGPGRVRLPRRATSPAFPFRGRHAAASWSVSIPGPSRVRHVITPTLHGHGHQPDPCVKHSAV